MTAVLRISSFDTRRGQVLYAIRSNESGRVKVGRSLQFVVQEAAVLPISELRKTGVSLRT